MSPAGDAHALERHQTLMRVHASGSSSSATAADLQALRAHFQFLRDDAADAAQGASDWRVRLSARYYRRLFREYALADLSLAREGRLGLRWRTAAEVVAGKGQFECGSTRCGAREALSSYELLFAYAEQGETKRCLVKVRVCEACAGLLFFRKLRQVARDRRRAEKQSKRGKKRRRATARGSASDEAADEEEVASDASSSSTSSSRSAGARRTSVHEACAAISARDCARVRARDAAARSAGGVGYFEDRRGGSDSEAFKDLLL